MAETLHAIVRDGAVSELRMLDAAVVPQHKRDIDGGLIARPYLDAGAPAYDADLAALEKQNLITPDAVTAQYTVTPHSAAQMAATQTARAEARAEALRLAVAGTASATKMSLYREKYAVAIAALAGDQAALDTLAPEAIARGQTAAELAALVKSLGDAWRAAGLAIDAACQAHKRAIAALLAANNGAGLYAYDATTGWPALSP